MKKIAKKIPVIIFIFILLLLGGFFFFKSSISADESASTKLDNSLVQNKDIITASGDVTSSNEANLHFQIAGKLTYLPFAEGQNVKSGEVIAAIDSTTAQHAETAAEAQYRSAQAALNLVIDNIHLFQYGNGGFANVGSPNETETQKTQRQQAEEAVNAANDNVQSAKQALSLYYLTAPFEGIITHEDVTSSGVNVTPTTSFVVVDPTKAVFRAQIGTGDSNLIAPGASATVYLDGLKSKPLTGSVATIYNDKVTTSSGESAYNVDIEVPNLLSYTNGKFGGAGTVIIKTNPSSSVTQIPSWLILNNQYVWVSEGSKAVLKKVTVGESRGGMTEIIGGLAKNDQVIKNPKSIIQKEYTLL